MLPDSICFVDIETTGTSARYNRIIEIGILKYKNNKLVKKYSQLINPETTVDPFIENLTGIRNKDLINAPIFKDIKEDILDILDDSIFVAHNVRFDYGFLKNEFKRNGINFNSKHFCTVKLARILYPNLKKYNLDSIIENFNIECKKRHRAFDDAEVISKFYYLSKRNIKQDSFSQAVSIALKRPTIPVNISIGELDNLPDTSGVYIFYGESGMPIYIGKSINIRNRVLSHFSGDHLSSTDMKISQQIVSIETIQTAGEFGALLLESTLIKKHQPLYNRMLRNSRKMIVVLRDLNTEGYLTIKNEEIENIKIEETENILGVFRTNKQLNDYLFSISKDYKLCPKLLGIEKCKTKCFYTQINKCLGACINRENPLKYNLRFEEAFYKKKIRPWNFKGPILFKEKGISEEIFIIDKWCLLGSVKDVSEMSNLSKDYTFDYDTYKIINKFLMNKKSFNKISTIHSFDIING